MLFNQQRALDYMANYHLDALVATSPVNVAYFTDFFCWLDPLMKEYMLIPGGSSNLFQTFAVYTSKGHIALVINPVFAVNATDLWVHDLYLYGEIIFDDTGEPADKHGLNQRIFDLIQDAAKCQTPSQALVRFFNDHALTDARIGFEMEGLNDASRKEIELLLPKALLKDTSNLIRLIRMAKSEEELSRLTQSALINEQAACESLALARPNLPIQEMVRHYRQSISEKGADFDHYAFGLYGLGLATEVNYDLKENDVLGVDFGCIFQKSFSDTATTLSLRKPSAIMLERFEGLRDCLSAAQAMMKPSVKTSEVHMVMEQTLRSHGISTSSPQGHSLGLEVREYPIIGAANNLRIHDDCLDLPSDLPLEQNMVINLESMIFVPGVGSLSVERTLVVTANGCKPIIPHDRIRPFIPSETEYEC